jgi:hypothetical protein
MEEQSYANHRQFVPMFHGVLLGIIGLTLIGSIVNLVQSIRRHQGLYSASLIVTVMVALLLLFFFARVFPLKAQDRAIRAEENLRHYALTGKLLDPRLSIRQVVGLRFAGDEEFVLLARRAAEEDLSADQIKQSIKKWRPDLYRV